MPSCILVIDDHPLFRLGLRAMLDGHVNGLRLDEADSLLAAAERLAETAPVDLVVYDWHLPAGGGLRGLVMLCELVPATPVLVVSGDDTDAVRYAALQVGAADFVSKADDARRLREVVLRLLARGAAADVQRAAPTPVLLTPRQREILARLALGQANKRIALGLGISENTVRCHVSELLRALHAANRTEAVAKATHCGLLQGWSGPPPLHSAASVAGGNG